MAAIVDGIYYGCKTKYVEKCVKHGIKIITIAVAWITRKHGTTHRLRNLGGRMQSRKRYVRELLGVGM